MNRLVTALFAASLLCFAGTVALVADSNHDIYDDEVLGAEKHYHHYVIVGKSFDDYIEIAEFKYGNVTAHNNIIFDFPSWLIVTDPEGATHNRVLRFTGTAPEVGTWDIRTQGSVGLFAEKSYNIIHLHAVASEGDIPDPDDGKIRDSSVWDHLMDMFFQWEFTLTLTVGFLGVALAIRYLRSRRGW